MRRIVLAAAVLGALGVVSQTQATPTRRATISDSGIRPRQELIATSDRVVTRDGSRKERNPPPEQLIPDICRGC